MASGVFRLSKVITNCIKNKCVRNNVTTVGLLTPYNPLIQNARNSHFFTKKPLDNLWKSVISVSNAGKKRGRGKRAPRPKNLNKGQKIGYGNVRIHLPGLNSPLLQGEDIAPVQQSKEPTLQSNDVRDDKELSKQRTKLPALLRGWTGGFPVGRTIGPPDPIEGEVFDGFESWIVAYKGTVHMTNNLGRIRLVHVTVITGNRNGLIGFAQQIGKSNKSIVTSAKNRAGKRLIAIERHDDHTVLHNFYARFGKTKVYVTQKPKGYGLKCHRLIKACCEAIGIKDLHAKIEGSTNPTYVLKAFLIGLLQQKTYQEIANEKRLHLVQMRKENSYYPEILASPAEARTDAEIEPDENLDFDQYIMDGKIILQKKPFKPFYTKLPSWANHLRKIERRRDQDKVMIRLRAEYGDICSFLTEKYPEARPWRRNKEKTDANSEE